ncbi:hypothetical protein GSI_01069 [Ganoderma sinense ZZ0214-1]|uniref:Transporter n=1 Tax=Ganoderma sinense ZZ0214-1 TaxID=1077348 RepID=A0A2G8SUC1_9APHY|nr:hypothetical protein GSI_01069 [Ganoderma sinense ZZ0214-1]
MFFRVSFLVLCAILRSLPFVVVRGQFVAAAARTIIAIDDTYGDAVTGIKPVYNPPSKWIQGQSCISGDKCLVDPDQKEAWSGTWHDATATSGEEPPRTIDFSFEGNSIGVYCIVPQVGRVAEAATANMTFELDGELVGRFSQDRYEATGNTGDHDIQYNVAVYQNGSILQGHHTLRIALTGDSRILFDYALYSTESDVPMSKLAPPSPTSTSAMGEQMATFQRRMTSPANRIGVIIGAAVGGTLFLIGVGIVAVVLIWRPRRSTENPRRAGILLETDQLAYREHDPFHSDRRSVLSSADSATPENDRPATPYFPFNHYSDPFLSPSSISLTNGDTDRRSVSSITVSLADSIPLAEFPTSPSINQLPYHVVLTGSETHLIGPDNSMAIFARQQMAEREAELTRRTHETEAVFLAKNGVSLSSVDAASISAGLSSGSGGSPAVGSGSIGFVAGLQIPMEEVEGGDRADENHRAEGGSTLQDGSDLGRGRKSG